MEAHEDVQIIKNKQHSFVDNAKSWLEYYHKSSSLWTFFPLTHANEIVVVQAIQMTRCIICHPTPPFNVSSSCSSNNTHKRKGLQYNPIHGSTFMKKHLQNEPIKKFNKYKAKVKDKDGGATKCQKFKKRKGVPPSSIIDFFKGVTSYSKKNHVQFRFIKDLVLHVCKGYQNISVVESY